MSYFSSSECLFLTYRKKIDTIRVLGSTLIPTTLSIKVDINLPLDSESLGENHLAVVHSKFDYWLEEIVANSVMFEKSNDWARSAFLNDRGFPGGGNHILMLPTDPNDAILAQVFQAKLNALADDILEVGAVEIKSTNGTDLTVLFTGNASLMLPDMESWVGEKNWFSEPWWNRNDASTMDVVMTEEDDMSSPPSFAFSLDFLFDMFGDTEGSSEEIIVLKEFRPTIIESDDKS